MTKFQVLARDLDFINLSRANAQPSGSNPCTHLGTADSPFATFRRSRSGSSRASIAASLCRSSDPRDRRVRWDQQCRIRTRSRAHTDGPPPCFHSRGSSRPLCKDCRRRPCNLSYTCQEGKASGWWCPPRKSGLVDTAKPRIRLGRELGT